MNTRHFPAHGELNLSVEDQILVIQGSGPANTEMVLKYQREVLEYRQKVMHKPWASLVLLAGEPLFPEEAKSLMLESINQAKNMGLVATAIVFVEVKYTEMIRHFWHNIYQKTDVDYQFFDYPQEAKDWLNQQLSKA